MNTTRVGARCWVATRTEDPWYWNVSTADLGASGAPHDVFLYVVDVATGWTIAGTFQNETMERERQAAIRESWDQSPLILAAGLVRQTARAIAWDDRDVANLLGFSLCAATVTDTFRTALLQTGGVEGHWLLLVFTSHDAITVTTCAYDSSRVAGFLDRESLARWIGRAAHEHLRQDAAVAYAMTDAGGALISPSVQKLMDREVATAARSELRLWSSTGNPSLQGGELEPAPKSPAELERAIASLRLAEANGLAFAVVRIDPSWSDAGFRTAISVASNAATKSRLCFAVDYASLCRMRKGIGPNDRIGVLLDNVDADTPLTAIADESIEAIRFNPEFVARAGRNLRLSCVLESMLLLAHNLGLMTMGPTPATHDQSTGLVFDYVPKAAALGPLGA